MLRGGPQDKKLLFVASPGRLLATAITSDNESDHLPECDGQSRCAWSSLSSLPLN